MLDPRISQIVDKGNNCSLLIISMDNLGDVTFLSALPLLLAEHYPKMQIDFLVKDYSSAVASQIPNVRKVFSANPFWGRSPVHERGRFSPWIPLLYALRKNRYQIIILASQNTIPAFLAWLLAAPILIGYCRKRLHWFCNYTVDVPDLAEPRTQTIARLLEPFGIKARQSTYQLQPRTTEQIDEIKPTVLIHPLAGSAKKCVSLDSWLHLGERLVAEGFAVAWIVSPSEAAEHGIKLLRCGGELFPIEKLLSLRPQCYVLLGHDSGPSHIACALGVPVLAFYPKQNIASTPLNGPGIFRMLPLEAAATSEALVKEVQKFFSDIDFTAQH